MVFFAVTLFKRYCVNLVFPLRLLAALKPDTFKPVAHFAISFSKPKRMTGFTGVVILGRLAVKTNIKVVDPQTVNRISGIVRVIGVLVSLRAAFPT
jgi:hypothetical protein